MFQREILLDVSRLIWRFWRGGLATGVDRVCLAYVEHFGDRARAVVQRRGHYFVLNRQHSDELFALFSGRVSFRRDFLKLAVRAFVRGRSNVKKGLLYINVGHTGLDEPSLVSWIQDNELRAVFLIHDLIPLLHPEYCRPGEEAKHRSRMRNVLASAHGIIGNSHATIADVASFASAEGLPMPPSVAAWIAGSPIPTSPQASGFDRAHFIVVGTIEARKNHMLLFHIWQRLIDRLGAASPILLVVGQRGWEADQTLAMLDRGASLAGHVLERDNCNDDEMLSAIAGARALLMPSFVEGFGLPVAEALQLGTPVIASSLPVFREFAGDIPTYLDPLDGLGWERMISAFAGDSSERDRQRRAMQGYRAPNWQSHFQRVEEWIASIP